MLTLKQLRQEKELTLKSLLKKGVDATEIIAQIETTDDN